MFIGEQSNAATRKSKVPQAVLDLQRRTIGVLYSALAIRKSRSVPERIERMPRLEPLFARHDLNSLSSML